MIHQPIMITAVKFSQLFTLQSGPSASKPVPSLILGWGLCGVVSVVVLFLSYLTYQFIEKPARNWINGRKSVKVAIKSTVIAGSD